MKITPIVAALVIKDGGIILAKRETDPVDHVILAADLWCLPGGEVEEGEQPEAACQRGFQEETGIVIQIMHPMGVYIHDDLCQIVYRAMHKYGPLTDDKVVRIFKPDDLSNIVRGMPLYADRVCINKWICGQMGYGTKEKI